MRLRRVKRVWEHASCSLGVELAWRRSLSQPSEILHDNVDRFTVDDLGGSDILRLDGNELVGREKETEGWQ